jgi:hypothetical protein
MASSYNQSSFIVENSGR